MRRTWTSALVATLVTAGTLFGTLGTAIGWAPSAAASVRDDATPSANPPEASISCANIPNSFGASAASSIDATGLAKDLLSGLAKGAGSKVGGLLAGWALDSIFGSSGGSDEQTKLMLDELKKQLNALSSQVSSLHADITNALQKAEWEAERTNYENAARLVTTDSSTLKDYQIRLDSWLKNAPGSLVYVSQSVILLGMRANLGVIINHLNEAMIGSPGYRGLIEIFASVTRQSLPYNPKSSLTQDQFLTSEFTTPMSVQLDYYESLAVQAFNMLAEVNHLSWKIGDTVYGADVPYVETYANCMPKILANWIELATSGVGRLPDSVVADVKTGLMLSRSNLSGNADGSPLPSQYCWSGCFVTWQHDLSSWLTPDMQIHGFAGWRVPSKAEFAALVNGQERAPLKFLRANGFQWRDSTEVTISPWGG